MTLNFLFTSWEGGGNITPALEAVRRLVANGHRVRFMSDQCNRPEAQAAGASFIPWTRAPSRPDRTRRSQAFNDWAAPTPQEGLMTVIRDICCGPALAYAQDTLHELRREPADLVVTCELLMGVMAACESLGQKFVLLCPNISLSPIPGIPPLGPGLAPAKTAEDRALHAQIAAGTQMMFDSGLPTFNAARAALGLPPLEHLFDQFHAALRELLATSPAFDFPADSLPEKTRYVGPLISDPHWAQNWSNPWPETDTRPLVTVGFSTTFQNHARVLQNIIDALAPLPVRVLITLGGSIEPADLQPSPNCFLVDGAPHTVVMPQSALVITHGGHGTIIRGLVSRVPMLVIPHGRDQNDNAIRITERGAGLTLMPNATTEEIRNACRRLLKDPLFKSAAKHLGDQVEHDAKNCTIAEELQSAATQNKSAAA